MSFPAADEGKGRVDAEAPEAESTPQQTETPPTPPPSLASPPSRTTTTTTTIANSSIAQDLLARLMPFLSEQHIEVEARLCRFTAPQLPPSTTAAAAGPQIVNGSYGRIQVGVSAADFERMRCYVEEKEKLPTVHTTTEDVITRSNRYTYAVAEDGTECFVGCIEKKRLCNVEVAVPDCPYDIRLSVSTEVPREAAQAGPTVKPQGFVRRKSRWTATADTYEYAFTRVTSGADKAATFEVEIEGTQANAQKGVTAAWLEELLRRLLAMAQLDGNTGLPKSSFAHREEKRQR